MNAQALLENKGFYAQIRRTSGTYMSVKESELCEKVTAAFENFSSENETSNKKKNARSAHNSAIKYLGNSRRIVNGFNPDYNIPHSTFGEYLVTELVSGLEQPMITSSDKVERYTNEFFSTLENKSLPLLGKKQKVKHIVVNEDADPFLELAGYETEFRRIRNSLVVQLKQRDELKKLGIKPSNGVILYGPPGTGKTSIAKAVSKEAGINFYGFAGSEFLQRYVGDGPEKVRKVIEKAKANPPSIIFIDEADVIFARRSNSLLKQHEDILSQFLASIEGIEEHDGLAFVVSTNRYDLLDDAIVSRFRKQDRIKIPLPSYEDREKIFRLKLKNANHSIKDFGFLSYNSEGWSGRDIDNFIQEVAWEVFNDGRKQITQHDLEAVINECNNFNIV